MQIVVWDTELARPVESEAPGGWARAMRGECGLSVCCIYDMSAARYFLYDMHTIDDAVMHLNAADLAVGYNSRRWDTPILEAVSGKILTVDQYDILEKIFAALGSKHKGYKLKDVAERTIGVSKNGDGLAAPELVAAGRWAELHTYCMNDVAITKELFDYITVHGEIVDVDGHSLKMEVPGELAWIAPLN